MRAEGAVREDGETMKNLFNQHIPATVFEILEQAHLDNKPARPIARVLFSGGNDSRVLAHVVKPWFAERGIELRLAAVDTELSVEGWRESVQDYADLIGLEVDFWKGEGRGYYTKFVQSNGFPGNVKHGQVQTRLKGRAFEAMVRQEQAIQRGRVWLLSGIRKSESARREKLTSPYSRRGNGVFMNPLFYWPNHAIVDYLIDNNLPESPFKQGDCKCGATVHPDMVGHEWESMGDELRDYLSSLNNPMPWGWACYDKAARGVMKQMEAGASQLFDDGSIASFPVCVNCWRDKAADEESEEWGDDWQGLVKQ